MKEVYNILQNVAILLRTPARCDTSYENLKYIILEHSLVMCKGNLEKKRRQSTNVTRSCLFDNIILN